MVFRSTPSTVIHACSVDAVKASGSPEEKPSSSTTRMRRFDNAARYSRRFMGARRRSCRHVLKLALHLEPFPFDIRELDGQLALALQHFLQARLVLFQVSVLARQPLLDILALGGAGPHLRFQLGELLLQRLAHGGAALTRIGFEVLLLPAIRRILFRFFYKVRLPPCV